MQDPTSLLSRSFTDHEVKRILARASELQLEELPNEPTGGMSLAELEQVAAEAGLDPSLVRRAASSLNDERVASRTASARDPQALWLERTIDGGVSVDSYEAIVKEIEDALQSDGVATTIGHSLRWTYKAKKPAKGLSARSILVVMTPRNGRTTIRIEEDLRYALGIAWFSIVAVLGLSIPLIAALLSDADVGLRITVSLVSAPIGIAGFLLSQYRRRRAIRARGDELQALMGRLSNSVATFALGSAAESPIAIARV